MGRIWVVGETNPDGALARSAAEAGTLARSLAAASGREAVGVIVGADPRRAATELADYLPRVVAVTDSATADHCWAGIAAERVAALLADDADAVVLVSTSPDGRDVAGTLSALTWLGVLANAVGVAWEDGPVVEMGIFGGKLITRSGFTATGGIITLRPNIVNAEAAPTPGVVEQAVVTAPAMLPRVPVIDRVGATQTAVALEEARIIVSGGRGVGGPDGFNLVGELAEVLGGAVGASRAAVDSGWIPYAQQVGQTGKIVKPQLYLALGISGAIQHKVGMQTAETIVAVNRDPDAPIAEFADLLVVGDLFDVVPALLVALRARSD